MSSFRGLRKSGFNFLLIKKIPIKVNRANTCLTEYIKVNTLKLFLIIQTNNNWLEEKNKNSILTLRYRYKEKLFMKKVYKIIWNIFY